MFYIRLEFSYLVTQANSDSTVRLKKEESIYVAFAKNFGSNFIIKVNNGRFYPISTVAIFNLTNLFEENNSKEFQ